MDSRLFIYNENSSKTRVTDLVTSNSKEEKQQTMLLYDKKMNTVMTCIAYDKAIQNQTTDILPLQNKMHNILDEAFLNSKAEIKKGMHYNINIQLHLNALAMQIAIVKEQKNISRDIIEVACFKLALLCDLARGEKIILPPAKPGIATEKKCKALLACELSNVKKFKSIVKMVGFKIMFNDYAKVNNIIPVFSQNGSIGFNTILFAYFNDYYPVGFSANPLPVHGGVFGHQSVATTNHDYFHALAKVLALRNEHPDTFEQYKTVYHQIFLQKQSGQLDDITFKKDLLILFFLLHEIHYAPNDADDDVITIIKQKTLSPHESDYNFSGMNDDVLNQRLILGSIDFIKPLQELGYHFEHQAPELWRNATSIRAALLEMLQGFHTRHPEIELEPGMKIENKHI